MKITDIKTFVVFVPERGRNFTFVKVYTDEGLTGLGEAGVEHDVINANDAEYAFIEIELK